MKIITIAEILLKKITNIPRAAPNKNGIQDEIAQLDRPSKLNILKCLKIKMGGL